MGKTPGMWIKNLLGKKSSKSNSLMKREILKPADKGAALPSINEPLPELPTESPLFSPPVTDISTKNEVDSEREKAATSQNPEVPHCSATEDDNEQTTLNLTTLGDSQKTRHEQAATQVQAAFRGYLAHRAFRILKGIIKLQACIRGHLVRRQAVAVFSCVWGIVRLQALARGQKVRRSDIGIEAHKIYSEGKLMDAKYANSSGLSLSTRAKRLRKNAYVQKLLAASPTAMPLHLQYGQGEANSSDEWLERWTKSHFWEPIPQPKKNQDLKSQTKRNGLGTQETDKSRAKRSVRKQSSASVENGVNHSASESDKRKHNIVKKVLGHTTNPPTEKDKVKRSLRKSSDSTKDVSKIDSVQTKLNPRKDMVVTSKECDLETSLNLHDKSVVDELHMEANGETDIAHESDKDHQENGLNSTPKLPSYMAPTESAKARLRGQGSPSFPLEGIEKNGTTRRLSLPSSNGKFSTPSPRAQRLIQGNGKGLVKSSDRSLTSSRDGDSKNTTST